MRPYIGASPDEIVCCSCCGEGVLEVKCPLCVKEIFPDEELNGFCMTKKYVYVPNACVNASIVTLWFSLKLKEFWLTGYWWIICFTTIYTTTWNTSLSMEYCPKL